jgi:hypothetical protein
MKYQIKRIAVVCILLAAGFSIPVQGGGMKKIAQTGMKWLSIPIGARGSGLGGAFTAVANDAGAIFWNPAGLALAEGNRIFLNRTQWIADISVNAGALSFNTGRWGILAVSFEQVDWGTLHGTKRDPSPTGSGYVETGGFSPEDWAVGMGYAYRVSDKFMFGGHLRYVHENLGSAFEGSFDAPKTFTGEMNLAAFDLGTLYYTGFRDLRLAMSLQNFSQEDKYRAESFPLPLTFKFGAVMDILSLAMKQPDHTLTLALDALHPRDYSERLHFGTEYGFRNAVFLRAGYKTNYNEEDLSLGAGLKLKISGMAAGIDYAYVRFAHFDAVQMFSFDFQF